uniref:EGF-like domain-containing protein n=1 Tax=Hyaloperonospora arabidopsidis (strain Emoy2) TaxID=559515 RepID=M4BXV8_HYAAE
MAADDDPIYLCDSDEYCDKTFPGTVCIPVNNYGDVVSKCTPNTAKRPACRGSQPGLCPSFQSADIGYLNAHCVFVSEEFLSLGGSSSNSGSGSGSRRRRLMTAASNSSREEPATDGASAKDDSGTASSTSLSGEVSSTSASAAEDDVGDVDDEDATATASATDLFSVKIGKETVSGQFICLDVSDCPNKAADPTTCEPTTCQAPTSKEVCTYHGTCTYKSKKKITKRSCMCYAGYEGDKCEKEVSNACDVDCGTGGDCVDGECVCKEGFNGVEHKGKKGKPNQRCTRCTNDLACQNGNTCNTETGKCICGPGYTGDTCGATEDSCTTRTDCGIGACQVLGNGSSACFCPTCQPSCMLCDVGVNATFDCSTCPTGAATSMQSSKLLVFASLFVAVVLANLVM